MAKLKIDQNVCKGCGLCVEACPKKLLAITKDVINTKGYHPVQLTDAEKCVTCALCATMCPDIAITIE